VGGSLASNGRFSANFFDFFSAAGPRRTVHVFLHPFLGSKICGGGEWEE
jgi:hypothetical protein